MNTSVDNSTASTQAELVPREESLDVSAEQADDGSTAVIVTQYDEPVENASVEVVADSDVAGNYTTDGNGTVTLEQPTDDVNATIVAADGNLTDETVVRLNGVPLNVAIDQRDDGVFVTVTEDGESAGNVTVEVDADGDYSGTGTYETDTDGEVVRPLPSENVTVEVTATAGNETATTTVDLTVDFVQEDKPFGLAVSQFVTALQSATVDGPPGQVISEFVVGNNPGNAGDAPGQPDGAGAGAADHNNGADAAPGQSGDAPGNSRDAPGSSGDAPGNSGDAPGQPDRDDADDGNETADGGASESANGNAPDSAGPDSDGERDGSDNEEDTETAREEDTEDEDDADGNGEGSDGEEGDKESSEQDSDSQDTGGESDGNSGSDSAPGNSGNAPGRS